MTKKAELEALSSRYVTDMRREAAMQRHAESIEALDPETAHTPVSNRAAVSETMSFEPAFGDLGRDETGASEVAAEAVSKPHKAPPERPRAASTDERELDAWWGSFANEEERAAMRAGDLASRVVIGEDQRVRVTNTTGYPWRCICSLRMRTQDGSNYIGTGWLVSPRLVLTAGHCVWFHDHGGWAESIEVIPGRNQNDFPYGSATSRALRSVTGWTQSGSRDYDYGAIILPPDARFGDRLGWLGYSARSDEQLNGAMLNIAGYPGDKPSGEQWFNAQPIQSIDEKVLTYPIDTAGGQSGAPVWQLFDNGHRYGVGIHTNGHASGNSATRITGEVFRNITNWVSQAA